MRKQIIQIQVSKGDSYYVAEGVNLPIVTQAKTFDELMYNIHLELRNAYSYVIPAKAGIYIKLFYGFLLSQE